MKNFINTSFQKVLSTALVVMVLVGFQSSLQAQLVSPVITTPNGTSFCATLGSTLEMNETTATNPSPLIWNWSGPNGFSLTYNVQNVPSPNVEIPITSVDQGGTYMVIVDYGSGILDTATVDITVEPLLDWECPGNVIVTPDLTNDDCQIDFDFAGFSVDAINCPPPSGAAAYDYCAVFVTEDGTTLAPTAGSSNGNVSVGTNIGNDLSWDDLPFGIHSLRIDIKDGATVVGQCTIQVSALESRNNLACNDLVNLTLTDNCEAIVTPDMVLQGDYCFNLFDIEIENTMTGDTASAIAELMIDEPGLYNVTVTGQSGLSCWGQIFAEDKSRPNLDCSNVDVWCSEVVNITPGAVIRGFDRGQVVAGDPNTTIAAGGTATYTLDLDRIDGDITEVLLNVEIDGIDISNLEITLESPENTEITILDLTTAQDGTAFSEPCMGDNINVCMTDGAVNPYSMFGSPEFCRETQNALIGSFQPFDDFSTFYTEDAVNGISHDWVIVVTNNSSDPMSVVELDLRVKTNEGNFLTSGDIILSNGCSTDTEFFFDDEEVGEHCENNLWSVIERTWVVTNEESGNSSSCTQTINLKKWELSDIICPKSFDDLDQPALTCATADQDTGSPSVPYGDICGNFQVTSSDVEFVLCGPVSKKIIRTWSIFDWCTGETLVKEQIIKIHDNSPLVATCAPDNISQADADYLESIGVDLSGGTMPYITVAEPHDCFGDWDFVPPLELDNACNDEVAYSISYLLADPDNPLVPDEDGQYITTNVILGTTIQHDGTRVPLGIRDLPGGQFTWIKIDIIDECGNEGVCFSEVFVRDDSKPNPVCVEFTIVALGDDGCGRLPATSVDNGSIDNCGPVTVLVKKEFDVVFQEEIEYCCECTNGDNVVHLLVTDANGNTNTCSAIVEIQDNLPFQNTLLPADVTFNCELAPIDVSAEVADALANGFNYIDNCENFSFNVSLEDPADAALPLEAGSCGAGSKQVKYIITDDCGNELDTHTQTFTLVNSSLNNPSSFTVTQWPGNVTLDDCSALSGLEPEDLTQNADDIQANTSNCNDLAIGWDDQIFYNVDNACLKILRTWTVIDWCIVNANNGNIPLGTRTDVQVILVYDNTPPVIDAAGSVCIESNSSTCAMTIDSSGLVAVVTDACTDMFVNQNNTSSHSISYADGTTKAETTGTDARGSYPFGTSTITWFAEDHCGNVATSTTTVIVKDIKKPTPYCLASTVTATMSTDGSAEIWASDYDLGGTDNVTGNCNNNSLEVYFLETGSQTSGLTFDCDDIPNGQSAMISLDVWFEDEAGNADFCTVTLELQDNASDICPDTGAIDIGGEVSTEQAVMVENVMVSLKSSVSDFNRQLMTDLSGQFAFNNLGQDNNYFITGERDDNPLNGVSTLDLVLIQRHILGTEALGSPFKLIAADADNSGSVSSVDLITLRKLILGIFQELPNDQKSWRFPETHQTFVNENNPFPYSESIDLYNVNSHMRNQDLTGVKIGDVNASAVVNLTDGQTTERRSNQSLTLEIAEANYTQGEIVSVPVYAQNMYEILGFQSTLNFNANDLEFNGVTSGALGLDENNLGLYQASKGSIAISWNTNEAVTVEDDKVLFTLDFIAQNTSDLNELYIGSSLTRAEAYTADLEVINLNLDVAGRSAGEFVLLQNVPNPFLHSTDIGFVLPDASDVTLNVFDVNGRLLMSNTDTYTGGSHTITLNKDQLSVTGVMYYTVETAFGTSTKKMIQIR